MGYKSTLEKGSKKYICPQCNNKTYVRYINIITGDYLPYRFGRCDKETKCKYFVTPEGNFSSSYERPYTPPKPTNYHSLNLVSKTLRGYKKNKFIQFLKSLFDEEQVKDIIVKYNIGTSKFWDGATIFWQMDGYGKVRHGKVMLYSAETGKRQKGENGKAYISSVRAIQKLDYFNLNQCLFGLHLINDENEKIALVESEKTAIIMSIFKPEYVWLSTGSKQGFKYDMLKPIKANYIVAFPDKSEYNDWQNKAIELNELGFRIKVSEVLENMNYKNGTDLADLYLETIKNAPIQNYGLEKKVELTNEIENPIIPIVSETEAKLKLLAKKNPTILKMIKSFDLIDENGIDININLIKKHIEH